MKRTVKSLWISLLSLLLCFSMLIGTTYAWFTDSVESGGNKIIAGNLDIEMWWSKDLNGTWINAEDPNSERIFDYDRWEPGYTEVRYIKIKNAGNLAFKYALSIIPDGEIGILAEVIDVYFVENAQQNIVGREYFADKEAVGTLDKVIKGQVAAKGVLLPKNADTQSGKYYAGELVVAIALKMQETAGNKYMKQSVGDSFSIQLVATQIANESDSFGKDYDNGAVLPAPTVDSSASVNVTPDAENKVPSGGAQIDGGAIGANVPAGVQLEAGIDKLTLSVSNMENSGANLTLGDNEVQSSIDVNIAGVAENNTVPMEISLLEAAPKGMNLGNLKLYHVHGGATIEMAYVALDAAFDANNQFKYNPATGDLVLYMANFSEVAIVNDIVNAWEGEFDYSWYTNAVAPVAEGDPDYVIANADQLAAFGAIVGGMNGQNQDSFEGKTVKLIADINLGDKESENNPDIIFYPIGYNSDDGKYEKTGVAVSTGFYAFKGTFDGNGHTVANFYHNTWEMKGDHDWYSPEEQYYRDGMGLFGKIYGGTVKNLTVKNFSSDGEIATTGVIAAYADGATFENIAIFNCNPRVYNIGNGGIVGCVGWYAKEANLKTTFTNITVDNSNKISALWGSYDVACGGIVGQYYPTSGQSSANAGVHFENCHISAQMDVYNDVCANYQYYAYRYTGMLIGSVRENETIDGHSYPKMDGITAEGCTVHFGTWNDYYYCEFEKNGHPSYSGPDDYKFSRIEHSEINFTDSNGNGIIDTEEERASVTSCKHTHTAAEDNKAVYLPFNNLVTGYGWGVTTKVVGELEGVTILDREVADSVEKFEGKLNALTTDRVYTIDEIFTYIENCGVKVVDGAVSVTITNLDENGNVIATFTRGEKWNEGTISFKNTGNISITIQDYYFCNATTINATVTGRVAEEKFDVVMNNGNFLHRVGNVGTVALDKLFKAKDDVTVGTVSVTVEAVNGTGASGTYSNNAIQFNGTGVVKVTITDNDYCTPTEILLEVVDAVNATGATDATSNNVVLLSDVTASSIEVSNGYAFYGNGFTITFNGSGDYRSAALSYGFITLKSGGTLDNARVMCKVFPKSYMFTNEMTAGSDGRYPYGYSAIIMSDNSTVSNCYVYGARNNILVSAGNALITNTVTECGSLSNIQVLSSSSYTVTLDNVTTIQYQTTSSFDDSAKVLGFGVVVGLPDSTSNATIKLTGDFNQYNWVTNADTSVNNTYTKSAIEGALKVGKYQHTNSAGATTVNTGIAYMNNLERTITDERTNKGINYEGNSVSISGYTGYVYSIVNKTGNPDVEINRGDSVNGVVVPNMSYNKVQGDSVKFNTTFDTSTVRWVNTLTLDLDALGSYTFSFNDLIVSKYGINLNYEVKDSNGNSINKNTPITLNQLYSAEYVLVVTDDRIYDKNGELTGDTVTHEMAFVLYATKTSIEPPKFTNAGTATAIRLVSSKGGDWRPAYTVLTGVTVTYWSASESKVKTIDLSTLYNSGKISSNVWTYTCDDYTLTITGGAVHSDGTTITPVVSNNTLYFASTNKAFGTGTTSRNIILTYVFTDKNASTTWNRTETVSYSSLSEYDYDSFKNGTLKEPSSSTPCVTPDTLVTLADGTQKRIDQVTYADKLLVWDFYKGEYAAVPAAIIFDHGYGDNTVIKLDFSNGASVKVVNMHQFFDATLNKMVTINSSNVAQYVGHEFICQNGDGYSTVTLDAYTVTNEYVEAWGIMSALHYNIIVEGIFSADFDPADLGLFNYFEIGEDMKYDAEKMQADIEEYGLYTYEDFADYLTYEQFVAFNVQYFKIPVEKGLYTYEGILALIDEYLK